MLTRPPPQAARALLQATERDFKCRVLTEAEMYLVQWEAGVVASLGPGRCVALENVESFWSARSLPVSRASHSVAWTSEQLPLVIPSYNI